MRGLDGGNSFRGRAGSLPSISHDHTAEIVAELRMLARVADEAVNEVNLALWEEELTEESKLTAYFWDAA